MCLYVSKIQGKKWVKMRDEQVEKGAINSANVSALEKLGTIFICLHFVVFLSLLFLSFTHTFSPKFPQYYCPSEVGKFQVDKAVCCPRF